MISRGKIDLEGRSIDLLAKDRSTYFSYINSLFI